MALKFAFYVSYIARTEYILNIVMKYLLLKGWKPKFTDRELDLQPTSQWQSIFFLYFHYVFSTFFYYFLFF